MGKAYLTDGITVQPPHSNGKADRYANSDYWHGCANNAANAEAKFELDGSTRAGTSSPNFVTEVRISHRCDKAAVAKRRSTGIKVFVGVADGSEVQCGRSGGLEAQDAQFCSTAVVRCGLVANAVYVAVRGNGADPLNLVEVQAKGKVATVQAESDGKGNGGRRSLSPSQSHLRAHSQQGEAGATADHHQQQQQQEQQPSTTMAVLVGAALGMMAIGLVMGLVQLIRSTARASSSSALLPTAAVTL